MFFAIVLLLLLQMLIRLFLEVLQIKLLARGPGKGEKKILFETKIKEKLVEVQCLSALISIWSKINTAKDNFYFI